MLSNFQLGEQPLLQIYLVGQPQFRQTFARADMEQLRQRVIASYHLEPLDADQTKGYIEHRLSLVGWQGDPVFTEGAYRAIHEKTGGVPRRINLLCERLLLFGCLENKHEIDHDIVQEVAGELLNEEAVPVQSKAGTRKPPTPPKKSVAPKRPAASRYATAKSLARLSKRVAELEGRLNGHGHTPSGLECLLPAIDRLTKAVEELIPPIQVDRSAPHKAAAQK